MENILNEVNKLDLEARINLVMYMWDNISKENIEVPDHHKIIIKERLEKYHSGEMESDDWDTVKKRLLQ
jgi:putative addiction module component (TIGR02574 family)